MPMSFPAFGMLTLQFNHALHLAHGKPEACQFIVACITGFLQQFAHNPLLMMRPEVIKEINSSMVEIYVRAQHVLSFFRMYGAAYDCEDTCNEVVQNVSVQILGYINAMDPLIAPDSKMEDRAMLGLAFYNSVIIETLSISAEIKNLEALQRKLERSADVVTLKALPDGVTVYHPLFSESGHLKRH